MNLSWGKGASDIPAGAARDGRPRAAPGLSPFRPFARSTTISLFSVFSFFAVWQIAPAVGLVSARLTSQPSAVARAFIALLDDPAFYGHAWVSLQEFLLGFALALIVALPLGGLMGTVRRVRLIIDPPLMALYIAPPLILLPILTIWLGIGMASKVAVVFLGAIFPIISNTQAGMGEADRRLIQVARGFGARRTAIFTHVLVPGALPSILTGVRLAVGRGVMGVVVGELFVAHEGIGYLLQVYGSALAMDRLLVCALIVSAFGYALTQLVRRMEERVRTWRTDP